MKIVQVMETNMGNNKLLPSKIVLSESEWSFGGQAILAVRACETPHNHLTLSPAKTSNRGC
jgi:hypothetical protein